MLGLVKKKVAHAARGTETEWYKGWSLTAEQRERFRVISVEAKQAKARALSGECELPKHPVPVPRLSPIDLMPLAPDNGLRALSLFAGCGGLDLGFDRAGYRHIASYDILEETGKVLRAARPAWTVHCGEDGDVRRVDWKQYQGKVDVLHGGPPCQPFSTAGGRKGAADVRDMVPEFVRAVLSVKPRAFVMENVSGLKSRRFVDYLNEVLYAPLGKHYEVHTFKLSAEDFGVPQKRQRVFFVGFAKNSDSSRFSKPLPTHQWLGDTNLPKTMGVREALGLPEIGTDALSPTIRSGWTGPRHTTSVVNSATSMKVWNQVAVWPHGVAPTREAASGYIAKNNHFRLSVPDCMILQGFPEDWPIKPPVYKALGLIGNSVAPPMAYAVAKAVATALGQPSGDL